MKGLFEWDSWGEFVTWMKYMLYAVFVYLEIDMDVFKVLIAFLFFDTVTGVVKALKLDYKKFSFRLLMWGLVSKLGLLIFPLSVALLIKGVGSDFGLGVDIILKILIV